MQMRKFLYESVSRSLRAASRRRDAEELSRRGYRVLAECALEEAAFLDPTGANES